MIIWKPASLHSLFPKCIISSVGVLDGQVMGIVYDDTHQWLFGSCVKCIQTAIGVVKDSDRS